MLVAPIAVGAAARSYFGRYHSVVYRLGCLELGRGLATDVVPVTEVVAFIGVGGINLDGGPMIAWKRLAILTCHGQYSLEFHRYANAWLYRSLRERCPRAWGLPWRGVLEPPSGSGRALGRAGNTTSIEIVQKYYRRQVARTLTVALTLGAGSIGGFGWIAMNARVEDHALKVLIWLIVFAVIAALLFAEARRSLGVLREISNQGT
jgi:hypothetical protein